MSVMFLRVIDFRVGLVCQLRGLRVISACNN